jgi:hypothetical protein
VRGRPRSAAFCRKGHAEGGMIATPHALTIVQYFTAFSLHLNQMEG